jgi:hypothetical protein
MIHRVWFAAHQVGWWTQQSRCPSLLWWPTSSSTPHAKNVASTQAAHVAPSI